MAEFKGRYGGRLTWLEDKLWRNDGTAAERAEWKEKDELKAEKKQLVGVTNCNAYTILLFFY